MTELGNASRKRKAQSVWEELREEEEARVRARMQTLVAQKRLVQKQEGAVGLSTAAKAKNRKLDEVCMNWNIYVPPSTYLILTKCMCIR